MAEPVKLLGPVEIRELADRLGVRPTKTLGQNFVHDAGSIRKIVNSANLSPGERVLEVGPGLGSLTLGLLAAGHSVVAIEIDPKLAAALPHTVHKYAPGIQLGTEADGAEPGFRDAALAAPQPTGRVGFDIVQADAMVVRAADIPGDPPTALVANLPYNTAVPILLHLLAELPSLQTALVMVQAEVADRIAAPPGSKVYGVPSAKVAWYGKATRVGNISRNVFWPAPNVDSALVAFERHHPSVEEFESRHGTTDIPINGTPDPSFCGPPTSSFCGPPTSSFCGPQGAQNPSPHPPREHVFKVIDAAFAQRRKTLRVALSGLFGGAAAAEAALRASGIDPSARGETLNIDQFTALAAQLPTGNSAPGYPSEQGD